MTKSQEFIKQYVLHGTAKQTTQRVAERVAAVISDRTVKSTEVIREGGFVHGRVTPVARHSTTA